MVHFTYIIWNFKYQYIFRSVSSTNDSSTNKIESQTNKLHEDGWCWWPKKVELFKNLDISGDTDSRKRK